MKKRTKGKSRGRKISGTSKRMISTVPRHSFNAKLIDTGRRRVCHVFAQAEQRIFCRTKLQLNAIAICDAQVRTRELGTSCPLGYVHIVHRSTKKRTALERERERSKRENVKVPGAIEDGRRENREKEDDAHVHLRETGNGYDGNKAKKDGNGKLMAGATVGHRNGTARYINSLLDERRCFCVLRSATIFVHLSCAIGVTSRVPRPTIHAMKTRISR